MLLFPPADFGNITVIHVTLCYRSYKTVITFYCTHLIPFIGIKKKEKNKKENMS